MLSAGHPIILRLLPPAPDWSRGAHATARPRRVASMSIVDAAHDPARSRADRRGGVTDLGTSADVARADLRSPRHHDHRADGGSSTCRSASISRSSSSGSAASTRRRRGQVQALARARGTRTTSSPSWTRVDHQHRDSYGTTSHAHPRRPPRAGSRSREVLTSTTVATAPTIGFSSP